MKKLLLLSAGLILTATASFAAVTASQLAASYQADGFTAIEVTTGTTQIKVEAVKAGQRLEVVYDMATGAILSQEQRPAQARDASDHVVEVKAKPGDFTAGAGNDDGTPDQGKGQGSDDGAGHDAGDDHGGDNAGASGSDDGAGHDAGDDHGGTSGSGRSGHGGGDDKGGDRGGDHGGDHGGKSGGED